MHDRKRRRWRSLKMLGQGTFSRVMLATSQMPSSPSDDEEYLSSSAAAAASGIHTPEQTLQPERRTLVAVKVCEHGPRGGASEDRIEMSLKRELEIMKSIHHPSLVRLKAWNIEPTRAILVLSYCPGGDLFDVASGHRELLSPGLMRRIFAELVGAVRYLHSQKIVHRDIKLESKLFLSSPMYKVVYSNYLD
jgi:protein-serine/threonine kinase